MQEACFAPAALTLTVFLWQLISIIAHMFGLCQGVYEHMTEHMDGQLKIGLRAWMLNIVTIFAMLSALFGKVLVSKDFSRVLHFSCQSERLLIIMQKIATGRTSRAFIRIVAYIPVRFVHSSFDQIWSVLMPSHFKRRRTLSWFTIERVLSCMPGGFCRSVPEWLARRRWLLLQCRSCRLRLRQTSKKW